MANSPYISLNDAAKLTGRAKSTISKALKSGRISYISHDQETGRYELDPAEVCRVFPPKQETGGGDQKETPKETHRTPFGNSALSVELETLKERLQMVEAERERERGQLTDQIEDLRRRLDGAEAARERLTAQLTDQRQRAPEPRRAGFWARLTGQGA
jgi:hypothetical protein